MLRSDQSMLELFPSRRVWVRRRKNETYHPDCINSTMKHGGGKLKVWGCMVANGVGALKPINKEVNLNCDSLSTKKLSNLAITA